MLSLTLTLERCYFICLDVKGSHSQSPCIFSRRFLAVALSVIYVNTSDKVYRPQTNLITKDNLLQIFKGPGGLSIVLGGVDKLLWFRLLR